jgi:glutamine synthetase
MSLGEALDRLAEDDTIKSALPGDMYRIYHQYKQDEWERFLATTSNWDSENYMDCLP